MPDLEAAVAIQLSVLVTPTAATPDPPASARSTGADFVLHSATK
jgi:hypothetical protein